MQWTILPFKLAKAVYFHSSVIHDGQIVTFGGVHEKIMNNDIPDEVRINTVQICHVKVCSLQQMCWKAINYYCPDLFKQSEDALMEEGIPMNLIHQLKA